MNGDEPRGPGENQSPFLKSFFGFSSDRDPVTTAIDAMKNVANNSVDRSAELGKHALDAAAQLGATQPGGEIDHSKLLEAVRGEIQILQRRYDLALEEIRSHVAEIRNAFAKGLQEAERIMAERAETIASLEKDKAEVETKLREAQQLEADLRAHIAQVEARADAAEAQAQVQEARASAAEAAAEAEKKRVAGLQDEVAERDNVIRATFARKPPEEETPPAAPQSQAAGPTPEPQPKTTAAPPLGGVGRDDDMTGTHVPPQGHGPAETPAQSTWHDRVRDGARDLGRKAVMGLAILGVLFASYLLFRSFGYNSLDTVETRMANGGSISAPRPPVAVPPEKKAEPTAPAASDDEGLRTVITQLRNQVVSLQTQLNDALLAKGKAEAAKIAAEAARDRNAEELTALKASVDKRVEEALAREMGMYLKARFQFIWGRCKDEKSITRLLVYDTRRWGGGNPDFQGMVNEACKKAPEEGRAPPVVAGRGNDEDVDPPSPNSFGNEGRAPTRQRVHFGPAQPSDCPGRFDASARACRQ